MIIQPTNPELAFEHRLFILEEMPKNSICAEVGVREGTYSQHIVRITKPKIFYLIDPHPSRFLKPNMEHFEPCDMRLIKKKFERTRFKDSYFDWLYLDNGHKFAESVAQLKLAYKKVKRGGWIIGDDYRPEHKPQVMAVDLMMRNPKYKLEWYEPKNFQFKMRKL